MSSDNEVHENAQIIYQTLVDKTSKELIDKLFVDIAGVIDLSFEKTMEKIDLSERAKHMLMFSIAHFVMTTYKIRVDKYNDEFEFNKILKDGFKL